MSSNKKNGTSMIKKRLLLIMVTFGLFNSSFAFAEEEGASPPKIVPGLIRSADQDDLYTKFYNLFESFSVLSERDLKEIDLSIVKVALYRANNKKTTKLPANVYEMIENRITEKLMETRRFQVYECLECKTVQVLLKENSFSILRFIESNQRLQNIGNKLGIEGFFVWNVFVESGKLILNVRVLDARSGRIMWTRQYSKKTAPEIQLEAYTGLWGIGGERKASVAANPDQTFNNVFMVGGRMMGAATFSSYMTYGLGVELFMNMQKRDFIDVLGVDVNGKLLVELDHMFSQTPKEFSNWNMYFSSGVAVFKSTSSLITRAGLEIRFSEKDFLDFGFLHIPSTNITLTKQTGYQDESTFGGFSYDLTLGRRF
jgi:hypothetical protein